jgi:asparagine synthase (glutamine-hydrolysing)
MCGIVGIVMRDPRATVDEARLKRMRDVIRHRGPDGEGLWLDGPVGLGHRRLSIIDLATGQQPMANEDGSAWIVYNGEVYNHDALRAQLVERGHRYATRSDTETILHLYEEAGEACVERLRGMFAFGIWDRARRELVLGRDRLGIKPLYYAETEQEFLFASEIKALLAVLRTPPRFNETILPEYLATGFVSGSETFFLGVHKLLPGRTLRWSSGGGLKEQRYWTVPTTPESAPLTFDEAAREVRHRLEDCARSHLMSDVPLGIFLSGGIDSSALAAIVARLMKEPIQTFSVGFREAAADELPYARLVARAIGANHHEVVVTPDRFFEALPRLLWHEDEPIAFPSSVPLYFVSELAQRHVKVVLTGEGSDELLLGYNRYRVAYWNLKIASLYRRAVPAGLRRQVREGVIALPWAIRRYATRTFLAHAPNPRGLLYENFAVFAEAAQRRLLRSTLLLDARDPYTESLRCFAEGDGDDLARMSRADLQTYLLELLMKQDQMSMAASVESRVPFLDHTFVEYVVGLPSRLKLQGVRTKAVLRAAMAGIVPPEILHRRKMGFPVPVGAWLRRPFDHLVREFILGPRAAQRQLFQPGGIEQLVAQHRRFGSEGDRLWLLMNLEIWLRIFQDGEDISAVTRAMVA